MMPGIIREMHDSFIERYMETSESRVMNKERLVFPVNYENFIIPCSLMIKIIPSLE